MMMTTTTTNVVERKSLEHWAWCKTRCEPEQAWSCHNYTKLDIYINTFQKASTDTPQSSRGSGGLTEQ